jgi:hypothetical protein
LALSYRCDVEEPAICLINQLLRRAAAMMTVNEATLRRVMLDELKASNWRSQIRRIPVVSVISVAAKGDDDHAGLTVSSTFHVLLLCLVTSAAGAAAPDIETTTTSLGASVSVLQRYECNVVASAGEDGIVMIDTCDTDVANKLLASVQRLSDKPLRFVINTHVHTDHTGANAFFQKLAPIIASHNVRKWLITGTLLQTLSNSTSNTSVALGGITPPAPPAP